MRTMHSTMKCMQQYMHEQKAEITEGDNKHGDRWEGFKEKVTFDIHVYLAVVI